MPITDGDIRREAEAVERLKAALDIIGADLAWYWHWGDGCGGFVLEELAARVREAGYLWPDDHWLPTANRPKKEKIGRALSKRVMERDGYRCIRCGTHLALTCDHIIPESRGGPTTYDNLQTMCAPCNSKKGAKMPEGHGE